MGKRKKITDPLAAVAVLDQTIFDNYPALGQLVIAGLQQQFSVEQNVKSTSKKLKVPLSVQWITPQVDENGEKIPNDWKFENFCLVLVPSSKFTSDVRYAFDVERGLHNLLSFLIPNMDTNLTFKILVFDDECGNRASHDKKKKGLNHLDFELKRLEEQKLIEWVTECQIVEGIDISFDPKSFEEVAFGVVQATKSILFLDATKSDEIFVTGNGTEIWNPKKSGNSIAVSANGIGLRLLWQRYLMQISKVIGVEQAKAITANPKFSSPSQTFESYDQCATPKEGEQLLSQNCVVRPPASTKDVLALKGSRPNIGAKTSSKVFKVLTTTNGQEIL